MVDEIGLKKWLDDLTGAQVICQKWVKEKLKEFGIIDFNNNFIGNIPKK